MAERGSFFSQQVGEANRRAFLELDRRIAALGGDGSSTSLEGPMHITVKNTSGVQIGKGFPVYATGSVGASGAVEVSASRADTAGTMPALGLLDETLAYNDVGSATVVGVIREVDTSSYLENDELYVAPSGGLTDVRPTGASELVQKIGRVVRAHAQTGEILVLGAGRTNDIPNGDLTLTAGGGSSNVVWTGATGPMGLEISPSGTFESALYYRTTPLAWSFENASGDDILTVDIDGQKVGVLNDSPSYTLDVNGTFHVTGQTTADGDVYFQNNALVASNAGSSNIDHIWHDETNNAWNFVSDSTYKAAGNSALNAGTLNVTTANATTVNLSTSVHLTNVDADGSMRVQGDNGYIDIGPKNSTYCHIYTDRGSFYFNKTTLYANGTGNKIWHGGNDGSGSGLDADLLDGYHASSFIRLGQTYSTGNGVTRFLSNNTLPTASGSQSPLEIYQDNAGSDAFITFHVANDYAAYFGLDGGINDFAVGGWSMGANSYRVWHAGNSNKDGVDWTCEVLRCNEASGDNGSATDPSFTFASDTNTGLYRYGSDSLGFTTGGGYRARIESNGIHLASGDWFRSYGSTGWYNGSHGGGMYMIDSTWVRTYNNKRIYSGSGQIRSDAGNGFNGPNLTTTWSYNTLRWNSSNGDFMPYASLTEMKDDIVDINGVLGYLNERSLIYDLKPKIFREANDRVDPEGNPVYTTRGEYGHGMLAEEVLEVAPELAYYDHNGELLSYGNDALIPDIIAELQRLMPMIEELYGAAHPDWVPPSPRPPERAQEERDRYETARQQQAITGIEDPTDPLNGQHHLDDEEE